VQAAVKLNDNFKLFAGLAAFTLIGLALIAWAMTSL